MTTTGLSCVRSPQPPPRGPSQPGSPSSASSEELSSLASSSGSGGSGSDGSSSDGSDGSLSGSERGDDARDRADCDGAALAAAAASAAASAASTAGAPGPGPSPPIPRRGPTSQRAPAGGGAPPPPLGHGGASPGTRARLLVPPGPAAPDVRAAANCDDVASAATAAVDDEGGISRAALEARVQAALAEHGLVRGGAWASGAALDAAIRKHSRGRTGGLAQLTRGRQDRGPGGGYAAERARLARAASGAERLRAWEAWPPADEDAAGGGRGQDEDGAATARAGIAAVSASTSSRRGAVRLALSGCIVSDGERDWFVPRVTIE